MQLHAVLCITLAGMPLPSAHAAADLMCKMLASLLIVICHGLDGMHAACEGEGEEKMRSCGMRVHRWRCCSAPRSAGTGPGWRR
jgi:hypothetical protein